MAHLQLTILGLVVSPLGVFMIKENTKTLLLQQGNLCSEYEEGIK